ncbi:MAG: response regulator transcription factor [Candidatus Izemoplasmatales bacterium]
MGALIYSVEDDPNIGHIIHIALANSGYEVDTFTDGKSLYAAIELALPDLILLDIMLPDSDGIEILRKLRGNPGMPSIPIMIVSAKSSEIERVVGLDAGADDYLVKPFGVLELISRVKALLRRNDKKQTETVESGQIVLNIAEHACIVGENEVSLTAKEFSLLRLLMSNPNRALTRESILDSVWGYDYLGETRTLDVHVKEVRQKLARAGLPEDPIKTVRGIGYKFVP